MFLCLIYTLSCFVQYAPLQFWSSPSTVVIYFHHFFQSVLCSERLKILVPLSSHMTPSQIYLSAFSLQTQVHIMSRSLKCHPLREKSLKASHPLFSFLFFLSNGCDRGQVLPQQYSAPALNKELHHTMFLTIVLLC